MGDAAASIFLFDVALREPSPWGEGGGLPTDEGDTLPYAINPSSPAKAGAVSLRLGHIAALTTHCVVIHSRDAASLPRGEASRKAYRTKNLKPLRKSKLFAKSKIEKITTRRNSFFVVKILKIFFITLFTNSNICAIIYSHHKKGGRHAKSI